MMHCYKLPISTADGTKAKAKAKLRDETQHSWPHSWGKQKQLQQPRPTVMHMYCRHINSIKASLKNLELLHKG